MAVTEKLMAQGSFNVALDLSLVPNAILNAIQPFDQIVITNGTVEAQDRVDKTILPIAEYVGVVRTLSIEPEQAYVEGAGLNFYLGDDENKFLESETVNPGNQSSIAKTPFGIFGFSVCYDLRFAQLYRSMAKQGSEVLMVPSAFTKKTGEAHWHVLNRARAIENGAFVISACATGSIDGGGECYGHSLVIDPWGNVLADGGVGSRVVSAKINLADVKDTREKIPSLNHDRDFKLKIIDATKEI